MKGISEFIRRQWTSRPLAVFSVCFFLGILYRDRLPFHCGTAAAVLLVTVFFLVSFKCRKRRVRPIIPFLLFALLGCFRMELALCTHEPVPEHFSVEYTGRVISQPEYNENTERIVCRFRLDTIGSESIRHTVRLYLRSDTLPLEGICYGQTLRLTGHVWPQDTASNPWQFDSRKWLLSDGMTGMAAAKLEDVTVLSLDSPDLRSLIISLRANLNQRIHTLFPENAELVCAFILGDRSRLDSNLREDFNKTGVAHLICISGMHISVLAVALSKILRLFLPRNTSVFITISVIILYGFLIGFPPSLVRAAVMYAVLSLGPVFGRYSDSVTRIAAAFFLMLLFNPFYLYDAGFALSFSASAGIILLNTPLESLFCVDRLQSLNYGEGRSARFLRSAATFFPKLLCTTTAAQLATLPVIIASFGAQSIISIPVNLLAIPLAMFAYPLSLVSLLISYAFLPLGALLSHAPDGMFSLLTDMIGFFSSVPVAELRVPRYPLWLVVVHVILICGASDLSRFRIMRRRFLPMCIAGLIGISMLHSCIQEIPFRLTFLDAGQADAAVLRAEGKTYLFDVGDVYTPAPDYVSAVSTGVDAVFLSHPHYDHAGGLSDLIEQMPPKVIYVPEGWFDTDVSEVVHEGMVAAKESDIPVVELHPGDYLHLSRNVTLHVHAVSPQAKSVNDMSLLLEVCYLESRVLFTGDLSQNGEPEHVPDIDILKVAHHGSSTATSQSFLDSATPELSVISVGDNNYGHPSEETIARLHNCGSCVYRTDHCGAVSVLVLPNGKLLPQTYFPMEVTS